MIKGTATDQTRIDPIAEEEATTIETDPALMAEIAIGTTDPSPVEETTTDLTMTDSAPEDKTAADTDHLKGTDLPLNRADLHHQLHFLTSSKVGARSIFRATS